MSWDHWWYEATCKKCGKKGFKIQSSDDSGRSEVSWKSFSAFTDFPNHEYLVGRKRIDENEYAKCECGSTDIEIGQIAKEKDGQSPWVQSDYYKKEDNR